MSRLRKDWYSSGGCTGLRYRRRDVKTSGFWTLVAGWPPAAQNGNHSKNKRLCLNLLGEPSQQRMRISLYRAEGALKAWNNMIAISFKISMNVALFVHNSAFELLIRRWNQSDKPPKWIAKRYLIVVFLPLVAIWSKFTIREFLHFCQNDPKAWSSWTGCNSSWALSRLNGLEDLHRTWLTKVSTSPLDIAQSKSQLAPKGASLSIFLNVLCPIFREIQHI